jgi:hypothetical protein
MIAAGIFEDRAYSFKEDVLVANEDEIRAFAADKCGRWRGGAARAGPRRARPAAPLPSPLPSSSSPLSPNCIASVFSCTASQIRTCFLSPRRRARAGAAALHRRQAAEPRAAVAPLTWKRRGAARAPSRRRCPRARLPGGAPRKRNLSASPHRPRCMLYSALLCTNCALESERVGGRGCSRPRDRLILLLFDPTTPFASQAHTQPCIKRLSRTIQPLHRER